MLRRLLRSNSGCYTCRLRRKKCSEDRPVCSECNSLEITCYYVDEKPDWMDGGPRQKEMADRIKSQVKKQASQRRDRKYLDMLESGSRMNLEDEYEACDADRPLKVGEAYVLPTTDLMDAASPESNKSNLTQSSATANGASNGTGSYSSGSPPPETPWHSELFSRQENTEGAPDVHLLMIYLDFVVPYLFPHYKPPVMAGGRGWIMDVLQSKRSVYFTAISIASYYMGICMAGGTHLTCTDMLAGRLQQQLELGLHELQKEMAVINSKTGFDARRGLTVMQGMMQMLIVEVATSNKDHWKLHLNAAIALFVKILPDPERWTEVLHNFYTPRWPPPEFGIRRPWSTNQAALRFYTAELLYIDVIASTTLASTPRLCHYQVSVIPGGNTIDMVMEPMAAGPLYMDEFIGVRNWVLQVLGDVAALDSWKRSQKKLGSLSMAELASRGEVLGYMIKTGLASCDIQSSAEEAKMPPIDAPSLALHAGSRPDVEGIWLLATLSYLNVVLSGWQPSSPEISWTVSKATELLSKLPAESGLQAMTWPLCVSGCLAPPEDEEKYRAVVQRLGPLKTFGTASDALAIMERVWSMRDTLDEGWDIARCLNVLGHGVLLI